MSKPNEDLIFSMLRYFNENGYKKAAKMLEDESGCCYTFDPEYFEELMHSGNWDEAEKYVSASTEGIDNNDKKSTKTSTEGIDDKKSTKEFTENYSTKISLLIMKCKFIEALDRKDRDKAAEMLNNDLKMFEHSNRDFFESMVQLLELFDIWKHEPLSVYHEDFESVRSSAVKQLSKTIKKIVFGKLKSGTISRCQRYQWLLKESAFPDMEDNVWFSDDIKNWKESQIKIAEFRSLTLDIETNDKIEKLLYSNKGHCLMALCANGSHFLWKWPGVSKTEVSPALWGPEKEKNDLDSARSNTCLLSASGARISLFDFTNFKKLFCFMTPPLGATCAAIHPLDAKIFAVGCLDGKIAIYNERTKKIEASLEGHTERVTDLAFSMFFSTLVSISADGKILTWEIDTWLKKKACLQLPAPLSDMHLQIHKDQLHFLLYNRNFIAVYDCYEFNLVKCIKSAFPISGATFSADCQIIYCILQNGYIVVFDPFQLKPRCRICPENPRNAQPEPVVIAAQPLKRAQIAVGFSNGKIYVLELSSISWK